MITISKFFVVIIAFNYFFASVVYATVSNKKIIPDACFPFYISNLIKEIIGNHESIPYSLI